MSDLFKLNEMRINTSFNAFSSASAVETMAAAKVFGWQQSQENLLLKKGSNLKVIVGKKKENEYNMAVMDGISPFQAFSVAMVWLE